MVRKILTKILMFGKAVVKIPSLDFSKVATKRTKNRKYFFNESVSTETQLDTL
jgi:hypothetical protein